MRHAIRLIEFRLGRFCKLAAQRGPLDPNDRTSIASSANTNRICVDAKPCAFAVVATA